VTELAVARTWVCVFCRARVPLEDDVCPNCGREFGAGLRTGSVQAPRTTHRGWVTALRELTVLGLLFIVWEIVGHFSLLHSAGAEGRGRWIWHAERTLRLPSEAAMQRGILGDPTLCRLLNGFYSYAHAGMLAATLLWLLWRHREHYARWRNLVVAFTGVSFVVQLLPVAPPRLVPSLHMVDLAARFHQSVYASSGGVADQLSTMPSLHIGWAVLVAAAIIRVSRSRWRWLAVLHPIITTYVVIVTANHYWLDGVVAVALLAAVAVTARRIRPQLVP
jgi:hypothetical protein